jgi:hypothetical protein
MKTNNKSKWQRRWEIDPPLCIFSHTVHPWFTYMWQQPNQEMIGIINKFYPNF